MAITEFTANELVTRQNVNNRISAISDELAGKSPADHTHPAKADKVTGATSGNLAGLDADGNLTDSGKKAGDFAGASHDHDERYYTETETDTLLAGKAPIAHVSDTANPHSVTAAQAGALPLSGGTLTGTVGVKNTTAVNKFISSTDTDESQLIAWLNARLAEMISNDVMPVVIWDSPFRGTQEYGWLYRHSVGEGAYASLLTQDFLGSVYARSKYDGAWGPRRTVLTSVLMSDMYGSTLPSNPAIGQIFFHLI